MSKVSELNKLAQKITGQNPKENTIREILDEISTFFKGSKVKSSNTEKAIKNVAENYSGGGGEYNAEITEITTTSGAQANITKVDLKDVNITKMHNAFKGWTSLEEVENLDVTNVEDFGGTFQNCSNLVSMSLNTPLGKDFLLMFSGCSKLENVSYIDMSHMLDVSKTQNMFYSCTSLTNESLHNIIKSLASAKNLFSGGTRTLLSVGLTESQATACTEFEEWATLTSRGWTTGY